MNERSILHKVRLFSLYHSRQFLQFRQQCFLHLSKYQLLGAPLSSCHSLNSMRLQVNKN